MQKFINDDIVREGKVIRKLGNRVTLAYLISKDNVDYFVKYKPVLKRGKYAKIYSFLGLTNLLFKKEIEAYKNLNNISFQNFKYPKLISFNSEYLLTEFIIGQNPNVLSNKQKEELARSLAEFQILGGQYFKYSFKINTIFKITSWRLFTLLRRNVYFMIKTFGISTTIKTIFTIKKHQFTNKKQNNRFLVHGDISKLFSFKSYSNIINHGADGIYIIDFDSLRTYKKFTLEDIVKISFRLDSQFLDFSLIKIFLSQLQQKIHLSSVNIENQIRYELIFIVCNQIRIPLYSEDCKDFLCILLNRKSYEKWLNNQMLNNL